MIYVYIVVLF